MEVLLARGRRFSRATTNDAVAYISDGDRRANAASLAIATLVATAKDRRITFYAKTHSAARDTFPGSVTKIAVNG